MRGQKAHSDIAQGRRGAQLLRRQRVPCQGIQLLRDLFATLQRARWALGPRFCRRADLAKKSQFGLALGARRLRCSMIVEG